MSPRGVWLVLAFAAGCSSTVQPEIVVEVTADESLRQLARSAHVSVLVDGAETNSFEIGLGREHPNCFPFSFSIVPADSSELGEVSVSVRIDRTDGASAEKVIETEFQDGARLASLHFERACVADLRCASPVSVDLLGDGTQSAVLAALAGPSCDAVPTIEECIDSGGCYAGTDPADRRCVTECGGAPEEPEMPRFPMTPISPRLSSCPTGWSSKIIFSEIVGCEPWPGGVVDTCAPGEANYPGDPTCRPLGAVCAGLIWPPNLPAGALHVDPNAAPGGDGSEALPIQTIEEAIARAADDDVIALRAGNHVVDATTIVRPLRFIGTCARETVLRGTAGRDLFAIAAPVTVQVEELSVREGRTAFRVSNGALRVHGIEFAGVEQAANVTGGRMFGERIRVLASSNSISISGTGSVDLDQVSFEGVGAQAVQVSGSPAIAAFSRVAVRGAGDTPFTAAAGARLELTEPVIEDVSDGYQLIVRDPQTVVRIDDWYSRSPAEGIWASGGATLEMNRGLLIGHEVSAIAIKGAATASISDVVVDTVVAHADEDIEEQGAILIEGAVGQLWRVAIKGAEANGIRCGSDGELRLEDLDALDTPRVSLDSSKAALAVHSGCDAQAVRVRAVNASYRGLILWGPTSIGTFEDVTVRGTFGTQSRPASSGINFYQGTAILRRAIVDDNMNSGISLPADETNTSSITMEDVQVSRTLEPPADSPWGSGITMGQQQTARAPNVTLRRAWVHQNYRAGIRLRHVNATLRDVRVEDSIPITDGTLGMGIIANSAAASLDAARILLKRNATVGIYFEQEDVRATFTDIVIDNTVLGTDADQTFRGTGMFIGGGSSAELTNFRFADNAYIAVFLGMEGSIDLTQGDVFGNVIGIAYRDRGGHDRLRLLRSVSVRDNDVNLLITE